MAFAQGGPPAMPVGVAEPVAKRVTQWDEFSGRFEALASVEVRARVSGFIDKLHFRDGQIVKAGDPLFTIDQRPFQIAVESAQAEVARTKAQVDLADLRPLNIGRMGVQTYDITHYQPILFCARGFTEIEDVVGGFFADVDDDMVERLMHDASQVTGR